MSVCKYIYKGRPALEHAKKNGIPKSTFIQRINAGWSVERACTIKSKSHIKPPLELVCAYCGKHFYRLPHRHNTQLKCGMKHTYCSKSCAQKARKHTVDYKICEHCGKKFYPSTDKVKTQKYCSIKCRNKGFRKISYVVSDEEFTMFKKKYIGGWKAAVKKYSPGAPLVSELIQHIDCSVFNALRYNSGKKLSEKLENWMIHTAIKEGVKNYFQEFVDVSRNFKCLEDCLPVQISYLDDREDVIYMNEKIKSLKNESLGYKYLLEMHFQGLDPTDVAKKHNVSYMSVYHQLNLLKDKFNAQQ